MGHCKKIRSFESMSLDVKYGEEVIKDKNQVVWVLLDKSTR